VLEDSILVETQMLRKSKLQALQLCFTEMKIAHGQPKQRVASTGSHTGFFILKQSDVINDYEFLRPPQPTAMVWWQGPSQR
jgi:hypothetical protein